MARMYTPYRSLLSEADMEDMGPGGLLGLMDAGQQVPQVRAATQLPALNYQDIIAQATQAGFTPYAGDGPMQAMVGALEVNPYFELTGQTEQDIGTPQQMGYTISTPLGGTNYRSDVVDMAGNLQRSNVHDAGADKYGLQDMAKLAAVALGANTLPGLMGGAQAPALTGVDAAMADLAASGGLTAADMAASAADAISTLPAMAAPTTAASTAPYVMSSADKAAMLSGEAYGPGMSGLQTSAFDTALGATGSKTLADLAANAAGAGSTAANWLKDNPTLAKLLFSGAGALLSATGGGGGGGGGGGYVDSGYRPTISRGGFNAAPQARQMAPQPTMGLLSTPTTGQPMSGLWRYGLLGG